MKVAKITLNDIVNGEGICLSLWLQGCDHFCKGCFNKETWDYNGGRFFTEEDSKYILSNIDFRVERNLSILGGDPLYKENLDGLYDFLKNFRRAYPNKKIYLWTGYLFEEIINNERMKRVIELVNVLIDGRFEEDEKDINLWLCGSTNQRIIDVQKSFKEKEVIIYKY